MKLKFGVPCSKIKDKIQDVEINCTDEAQAFAIAAGCILAGKEPEVYMQNSGLLNSLDILLSLYRPYGIPYPKLLLSLRRKPEHHRYVGRITYKILQELQYANIEIVEQGEE